MRVRLVNQGADIHEAVITRVMEDDGSADRYVEEWRKGVSWPSFAVDVGGTALTPSEDSSEVWLRLEAGRYVVICTKGDHLRRGMASDLTVLPNSLPDHPDPVADLTLELVDYAFVFPAKVPAGRHLLHVVNHGTEPHEMDVYRVPAGKGLSDWIAWSNGGEKGTPPLELVGGGADFYAGHEEWFPLELTPGRYLIICGIPQGMKDDGAPHYALGMTWTFEVE